MSFDHASNITMSSVWLAIQIAGPLLLVCLVVGLLVSLFQAATQLSDSAMSFVPKLFVTIFAGAALLPWMMQRLAEFARSLIESIPQG